MGYIAIVLGFKHRNFLGLQVDKVDSKNGNMVKDGKKYLLVKGNLVIFRNENGDIIQLCGF